MFNQGFIGCKIWMAFMHKLLQFQKTDTGSQASGEGLEEGMAREPNEFTVTTGGLYRCRSTFQREAQESLRVDSECKVFLRIPGMYSGIRYATPVDFTKKTEWEFRGLGFNLLPRSPWPVKVRFSGATGPQFLDQVLILSVRPTSHL